MELDARMADSTAEQRMYDKFDSKSYIHRINTEEWRKNGTDYLSDWMHAVFSEGKIRGETLLDIGTGPIINSVLYAAPYFNKIYLSDFSNNCREFLNEWRNGEHSELQRPFCEQAIKLEGSGCTPEDKEEILKRKITDVLYCDVNQENPVGGNLNDVGKFDAVTTSWTLSAAVSSGEDYKQALMNVMSLVKPGGHLILMDITSTTYQYKVDNILFDAVRLTGDEMMEIIESACPEISFSSKQSYRDDNGIGKSLVNVVVKL